MLGRMIPFPIDPNIIIIIRCFIELFKTYGFFKGACFRLRKIYETAGGAYFNIDK